MSVMNNENDRKGLLGTVLFHVLLLLVFLITGFGEVKPLDTDNGGVMVNFGEPDAGSNDNQPAASQTTTASQPQPASSEEAVVTSDEEAPEVKKQPEKPVVTKPKQTETKPTEQKEEAKPSIDPRLKEQLERMKRNKEGGGGGVGEGTNPGDKGQPDGKEGGDPDGTGKGNLGNGISYNLKGFSVSGSPSINNESQKYGTVVVEVCVNRSGRIISTKLGRGSTTNDTYLYSLSEKAVRELNIRPTGNVEDTNCGTVSIKFERQ